MNLKDMFIALIEIMWYRGQLFEDTKGKDVRQPLAVRLDKHKNQIQKHQVHPLMKVSQSFVHVQSGK